MGQASGDLCGHGRPGRRARQPGGDRRCRRLTGVARPAGTIESRANAVITTDAVRLTAFEAISGPARATSTLTIDLTTRHDRRPVRGTAVPIESWLRRFDLSAPVTGTVDATGRLSGPLSRIVVDADVDGRSGRRDRTAIRSRDGPRASTTASWSVAPASRLAVARAPITGDLTWTRQGDGLDGTFQMTSVTFDTHGPRRDRRRGSDGRACSGPSLAVARRSAAPCSSRDIDLALSTPDVTLDQRRFGPVEIEARTETAAVTRVAVDGQGSRRDAGRHRGPGGRARLQPDRAGRQPRLAAGRRYARRRARAWRDDAARRAPPGSSRRSPSRRSTSRFRSSKAPSSASTALPLGKTTVAVAARRTSPRRHRCCRSRFRRAADSATGRSC